MGASALIGVFVTGVAIGGAGCFFLLEPTIAEVESRSATTPRSEEEPVVFEYFYDNGQVSLREVIVGANWGEPEPHNNGLSSYTIDEDYESGKILTKEWFTRDGHLIAKSGMECATCMHGFYFDQETGGLKAIMRFQEFEKEGHRDMYSSGPVMLFDPPVMPSSIQYHVQGAKMREVVLTGSGEYQEVKLDTRGMPTDESAE